LKRENGREALEILKEQPEKIDMILLDLMMPEMDGTTFLEKKAEDEKTAGIPVIIITVDDTVGRQMQTLSLGAEDYIVKPFVPEIALRRVDNILGIGRLMGQVAAFGETGLEVGKV